MVIRADKRRFAFWLLPLGVAAVLCGCASPVKRGIVYQPSTDPLVENGVAFDNAELSLGEHQVLVIPSRAQLEESAGDAVRIEMEKTWHYNGHPPDPVSIDDRRTKMGVATRSVGSELILATYGESDTGGDGGGRIELTVFVPPGVRVERRDDFEMKIEHNSPGGSPLRMRGGKLVDAHRDESIVFTPLADQPDPERAAKHR